MIVYQKVIIATGFTDSFKADKAFVTFDLLNDTLFQVGITFDQQVDFQHSEYILMPGEVVQGITPPRVKVILGQAQYGGTIFIVTRAPAGGVTPIGPPGSELTIIGYEAGRQPVSKTYMYRISNVGNTIGTVVSGATNIQNDGNALGTTIIESTPTGAAQTWNCTNDGIITIKGDVGGVLTTLIQTIPSASGLSQSSVKLGDSGRQVEILGQFLVDLMLLVSGRIQPNVAGTSVNGTAGTATAFFPLWGTALKVAIIQLTGYSSNANAQFIFPSSISVLITMNLTGFSSDYSFLNGATTNNSNVLTAIAATGGTTANQAAVPKKSLAGNNSGNDRIQLNSGFVTDTGVILVIGV